LERRISANTQILASLAHNSWAINSLFSRKIKPIAITAENDANKPLEKIFRAKVLKMLKAEGKIGCALIKSEKFCLFSVTFFCYKL